MATPLISYVFDTQSRPKPRGMTLKKVKAHYVASIDQKDNIIKAVQEKFGKAPEIIESWMVISGEEDGGLEYFKLSVEEDTIKVLVKLSDDSLLSFFNGLIGKPVKMK